MTSRVLVSTLLLAFMATPCVLSAERGAHGRSQQPAKEPAPTPAKPSQDEEGQSIFKANCSRCHEMPEAFSSSLTNTVLRHMRVRANLSAHDEEELRRFFNN